MTKRLAESKRIRTAIMGCNHDVVTAVATDVVGDAYTFQDDVTIIGYYMRSVCMIEDAMTNTDSIFHGYGALSRSGRRSQPGEFGRCGISGIWNGLFYIGATWDYMKDVIFPEGYGIEVDEGETVNLLVFLEYNGDGGDLGWFNEAILLYVER